MEPLAVKDLRQHPVCPVHHEAVAWGAVMVWMLAGKEGRVGRERGRCHRHEVSEHNRFLRECIKVRRLDLLIAEEPEVIRASRVQCDDDHVSRSNLGRRFLIVHGD